MELNLPLNKMWRFLSWLGRRAICFYLAVFLLSALFINYQKIKFDTQLRFLNQMMPSTFTYLVEVTEKQGTIGQKELIIYRNFYEEMIKNFPDTTEAYPLLGFCYYYEGKEKKAIDSFQRSMHFEPEFFWNYYNLGVIYYNKGQYKEVIDYLKKGTALNPQKSLELIRNSKVIYRSIRTDDLIDDGQLLLRLKMGYQDAYRLLVLSHLKLKQYSLAMDFANLAIQSTDGATEDFYYYGGLAAYEMKSYDEATRYFQICLSKDPDHPEAYRYIGLILEATGKKDSAQKVLGRAEKLRQQRHWQPRKKIIGFEIPTVEGQGINLRIF